MKSLDVVPIRRARPRTWHDGEDEITAEVHFLGGLVAGPPVVVDEQTQLDVVREYLLEQRISAVVVVDGQAVRGLITRTDVLRMPRPAIARATDARCRRSSSTLGRRCRASSAPPR